MATEDATRTGFRIGRPVDPALTADDPSASAPKPSEPPLVFAIARDSHTMFVYWDIDWASAFAADEPKDRLIFLRAIRDNDTTESEWPIEPLLGNYYAAVGRPRACYRAELGYYTLAGRWKTVGTSDSVTIPADSPSGAGAVDVATVPFHLSFQKLVDLFSRSSDDPLAVAVGRVQERALQEQGDLSADQQAALRAMDVSLAELRETRRAFAERPHETALRKRAEAILGFGATSPTHGFGDSSSAERGFGSAS
jgi:hypothetical protein